MKKLLLLPLVMCSAVRAEQEIDVKKAAEDTAVVVIKTVLVKNIKSHNASAWEDVIIRNLLDCVKKFETNSSDGITALCTLANALKDYTGDATGIHGVITISTGDGRCPKDCCAHDGEQTQCACLDRYAGTCPCSAEVDSRGCGGKVNCRQPEAQVQAAVAVEKDDKCSTCGKPPKPVKDAETQAQEQGGCGCPEESKK